MNRTEEHTDDASWELEAFGSLWRLQRLQPVPIDVATVRRRARWMRWKIRLRNWFEGVAGALVMAAMGATAVASPLPLVARIGCGALVFSSLYVLIYLYRHGRYEPGPDGRSDTDTFITAHRDRLLREGNLLVNVPR